MLNLRNVSYSYPQSQNKVLDDINIDFPSKGLFYIVGESGSGKTTLLNVISGLFKNYEGEVIFDGEEMKNLTSAQKNEMYRSKMAYSTQEDLVGSNETVEQSLFLPLELYDLSSKEKESRIRNAVRLVALEDLLKSRCSSLSGGEIKRVSLARVLVRDYDVLLLDEPLGPLDFSMREKIEGIIKSIAEDSLVIIVTHNTGELKPDDNVIRLKDGKITTAAFHQLRKEESIIKNKAIGCRFKILETFKIAIRMFLSDFRHSCFSSFASSLALIAIGLIVLVSKGISSGLSQCLAGSMSPNTVLVQQRERKMEDTDFSSASYADCQALYSRYSESLMGVGAYYEGDFENFFVNANKFYFALGRDTLSFPDIDFRCLAETAYYKELKSAGRPFLQLSLTDEEIGLGLTLAEAKELASFYGLEVSSPYDSINAYLTSNNMVLNGKIENSQIHYRLFFLFKVRLVIPSSRGMFIHTNPFFSEWLFDDFMCFSNTGRREEANIDFAKVYKAYYLMIDSDRKRSFLEELSSDSDFSHLAVCPLKDRLMSYYQPVEEDTQDRYVVYNRFDNSLSYADIQGIEDHYSASIDSVCYSDSFYYFSSFGYGGGFIKPIYASGDRGLLNKIADYNYNAQFDLHGFQGSTIQFDEGVVMGDLSGTCKNPLQFKAYLKPPSIIRGVEPQEFNQVLISDSLAKELFGSNEYMDKALFLSCLSDTVYKNGGYKNVFKDGQVTIVGIVESEDFLIYQKPRFLNYLQQDQFGLNLELSLLDHALIEFSSSADIDEVMDFLEDSYSECRFSLPVKKMADSVENVVGYIVNGLLSFAFFSALIAAILMVFVIFLFVQEGQNRIKMMQMMGFNIYDISSLYWSLGLLMSLSAYVSSSFFLLFFSFFFGKALETELGLSFMGFAPEIFLVNLVFAIVLSLLSGFITQIVIRRKDVFSRGL